MQCPNCNDVDMVIDYSNNSKLAEMCPNCDYIEYIGDRVPINEEYHGNIIPRDKEPK